MPAQLQLDDIQGNILAGFNKDYLSLLFLQFTDRVKARAWLARVTPEIASTTEVRAFNRLWVGMRKSLGGEPPLEVTWTNLALSYSGLEALGVPPSELAQFPQAFRDGMKARAGNLGDQSASAPKHWVKPLGSRSVHAVLLVAADAMDRLDAAVAAHLAATRASRGVRILLQQDGATRADQRGHEHFGFRDGISQPGVRGYSPPKAGQDRLWPGEFVLGYPTQIATPAAGKPAGSTNANPGPVSRGGPRWTDDGSYLVVRRLRQDVDGFNQFLSGGVPGPPPAGGVEEVAAKLVGRYRSGKPLVAANDAASAGNLANDFVYGSDPTGARVPLAAHIRKANPRDQSGGPRSEVQTRRLLRRGITFGKSFQPGDGNEYPNDRGVLFLAYQSDIERQFEHVQSAWVNNPFFPSLAAGHDPIATHYPESRAFTLPSNGTWPAMTEHLSLMSWVTNTGGEYFFQPSIPALNRLSKLAT